MSKRKRYTPAQRRSAMELYAEVGGAETSRRLGIPRGTLRSWAAEDDVHSAPRQLSTLDTAREVQLAAREIERVEVQRKIIDRADRILDRINDIVEDAPGVTKPGDHRALSAAAQSYALAFAVLLDKYRLEAGEVTDRTEAIDGDPESVDRSIRALAARLRDNDPPPAPVEGNGSRPR